MTTNKEQENGLSAISRGFLQRARGLGAEGKGKKKSKPSKEKIKKKVEQIKECM